MEKVLLLFMLLCVAQICWSKDISGFEDFTISTGGFNVVVEIPSSDRAQALGKKCEHGSSDGFMMTSKRCPSVAPQNNYTELMNLNILSDEFVWFIKEWVKTATPSNAKQAIIENCNFKNSINYFKSESPSIIASIDQICELGFIADEVKANADISDVQQADISRRVCRIYSDDGITTTKNSTSELSTEQLTKLLAIRKAGNCDMELDCDDMSFVFQACRVLNETVSEKDQAKKLGISVELYKKLVAARKLYSKWSDEGRLAVAKRTCEALVGIESNGINLALEGNTLSLPADKLAKFTDLWIKTYEVRDNDKIAAIFEVCSFLRYQHSLF